jgi:hypothetical protein
LPKGTDTNCRPRRYAMFVRDPSLPVGPAFAQQKTAQRGRVGNSGHQAAREAQRPGPRGQTSKFEFCALYTQQETNVNGANCLRRLLGTRLATSPRRPRQRGLRSRKEIDVWTFRPLQDRHHPPVPSQRRGCLITGRTSTLTANANGRPNQDCLIRALSSLMA